MNLLHLIMSHIAFCFANQQFHCSSFVKHVPDHLITSASLCVQALTSMEMSTKEHWQRRLCCTCICVLVPTRASSCCLQSFRYAIQATSRSYSHFATGLCQVGRVAGHAFVFTTAFFKCHPHVSRSFMAAFVFGVGLSFNFAH